MRLFLVFGLLSASAFSGFAQLTDRYALILQDAPVAAAFSSRAELQSVSASGARARIEASHVALRNELSTRRFRVTGSASTLVNAVFVSSSEDRADELRALPGVIGVVRLHKYKRSLNTATQLLNAPAAWNLIGGMPNGGAGVKVGIIDSGIDQNHPSLRDTTLSIPAGFPKCTTPADCAGFTNNKVIVARSYVRQLALGTGVIDPKTSRADDYSARDRSGHGTAVATCVAGIPSTGTVTINGMAPKAWVGNYKVFGSPQVNDFSTEDVLILALEDALADGMDIVSMSIGGPAFSGPLDTGAACGQAAGVPCDVGATAFERLAGKGVLVVVAAGNEGGNGVAYPTFASISSPADAPSVLTVGASTNSHGFTPGVRVTGAKVPSNLNLIPAQATAAGFAYGAYAGPLVDVASVSVDDYACAALPTGSLANAFALIQRGPTGGTATACSFVTKMTNAVNAGAAGVIFYDYPNDAGFPFSPGGLGSFPQPAVFISNADGVNLKNFIRANPGYVGIIDPAAVEAPLSTSLRNQLAFYSSMGPSLGLGGIKPDVLAVGGGGRNGDLIYMGSQTFDPLGDVYSATGYIAAAGTSFATPLTAGAAALVKQAHPGYTAGQMKSALVNTATSDVLTDDSGNAASILQTGGGKVSADLAIQTNVTVEPATLSFGALGGGALAKSIPLRITNTSNASVTLNFGTTVAGTASPATLALDNSRLTIAAQSSAILTVSLSGTTPSSGVYAGAVTITGGTVPLRVPYLYLVGSTSAANIIPLAGGGDGSVGLPIPEQGVAFQIVDANGVPVANAAVSFAVATGSVPVTLSQVSTVTDAYGIASANVTLGTQSGSWAVNGCLGACTQRNQFQVQFSGAARKAPTVSTGGIVNAASASANTPLAPGSYFSIYGSALSDSTGLTPTAGLPLAIDAVNVSFDVPSAGLSVPAHLVFVSAGQINAQVPWEMQGQASAQVKVTIDQSYSNVSTVAIANYAPAFFEAPLGSGIVAAVDPLNAANPVITTSDAAKRGGIVSLYANGLGPVGNQPMSGETASLTSLANTTVPAVVTIGGQNADVSFSGLTPGLPGLYQLNVLVPSGISAGLQPVIVTIGGQTSKALMLPVK